MKKIFLFVAAMLVAVTANAFSLSFQNSDLGKHEQIVSATDIDDVLGDGKVAVHFDSEKKTITVTLDGATLKGTNANPVFAFKGDASYTRLELKIKGQCAINATGTYGNAIRLESGVLAVTAVDPSSAKLDISGNSTVIHLQADASLMIGDLAGESFDVNITAANQVVFLGSGSGNQWLQFAQANISIKAEETTELAAELELLTVSGKISNGVVVEGNTFKKGGEIYKGNLDIYAPYQIMVGTTYMYPGEEESFAPAGLGSGSIKYDKSSKTLTLENAEVTRRLWIGYDDFTIYLKGNNSFENTNSTEDRIMFAGKNGKITGDASAELIINGAGYSKGIYAIEGLEIGEFNELTIQETTIGISGAADSEKEGNVLKITSTPMPQVRGTEAAIKNFKGLTITSNELAEIFASRYQYSPSEQAVVDKDDNTEIKQSISLIYPVYFTFCDVEVTGRNATDIPVKSVLSGKASYDKATATLTLNGFKNEAGTTMKGVENMTTDLLNIKLIGENILGASVAIETSYNLIVEGPGSLQINGGDNTAAIHLATSSELTIKNSAYVEVNGYAGIKSNATIDCMAMGMDPGDAEPSSNDAAVLTINNASLHVKSTDEGAIFGFREANLTDAKVEEADVEFVFDCLEGSSSPATFGFYSNTASDYAKEVTIVKTGATAVENIQSLPRSNSQKVIENGQVVILREGKRYNLLGAEMK